MQGSPMLSVVVPVYNEIDTIELVLTRVAGALPHVRKQVIVVDDCSTDGTREWIERNIPIGGDETWSVESHGDGKLKLTATSGDSVGGVRLTRVLLPRNCGKGGAVRAGFECVAGDVIVVQDADLEYDPADWALMYELIVERGVADVVYGSRFHGRPHRSLFYHHYLGNRLISVLFNVLYDQTLSDVEVCYKMMSRAALESLDLTADDFGFEIEISAQLARQRRWRIYEVGISYFGRTYDEGKKITWRDGLKALYYLFRFRF